MSFHTQILRRIHISWNVDMAEVAAVCLLILITVGGPIVLKRVFKTSAKNDMLWLPCVLAVFCFAGRSMGFLVPWECGYDSFEEIYETLMASATVYFAFYLHLHLKEIHCQSPAA